MFLKKIINGLFIFALISQPSLGLACSVCFSGTPNNSMTFGLRMGVLALLVVLLGVLASFAKFFIAVRNRAQLKN